MSCDRLGHRFPVEYRRPTHSCSSNPTWPPAAVCIGAGLPRGRVGGSPDHGQRESASARGAGVHPRHAPPGGPVPAALSPHIRQNRRIPSEGPCPVRTGGPCTAKPPFSVLGYRSRIRRHGEEKRRQRARGRPPAFPKYDTHSLACWTIRFSVMSWRRCRTPW